VDLTPEEARVLGSLIEKQLTTPQYYPLTLNALVAACNQSNNRNPVVSYEPATVEEALRSLKEKGLVRVVHQPGQRAPKHRHVADERLGLDTAELALLDVLLLRGPQTPGELRSRTERMHAFDSLEALEHDLERLSEREPPLVRRLERQPGQKEARYEQLLGGREPEPVFGRHPDYVILAVDDLDRALGFWTGTLGLKLGHRSGPYAQLDTGATRLALYDAAAMRETVGGGDDRFEIGFKVADVDAAYEQLTTAGAAPAVPPTDRPWGQRTAYVRDPDGHLVELAQDL
jgi:uncharacterized protein